MATPFEDVIDLALVRIQDYKLNKLYQTPILWQDYLNGFLINAISEFRNCKQSLEYDLVALTFNSNLTNYEIAILASWFVYYWFEREVNNVEQFNEHLTDTDFKHYSEAQNLKEKSLYKDKSREIAMQKMEDYGMDNVKWKEWANGDFGI